MTALTVGAIFLKLTGKWRIFGFLRWPLRDGGLKKSVAWYDVVACYDLTALAEVSRARRRRCQLGRDHQAGPVATVVRRKAKSNLMRDRR